MPLNTANMVANTGTVKAVDIRQYADLFTGVMNDQPVTFGNTFRANGAATFASTVALAADPTLALQAVTKQYCDGKLTQAQADARYQTPAQAAALYLPLTGGTLSGPGNLTVAGTIDTQTIGPTTNNNLNLRTNNSNRWLVAAAGGFMAASDNLFDIGAVASLRPRTIYAATSFIGPGAVPTGGSAGQVLAKNTATNYDLVWSTPFTQAAADARYYTQTQSDAKYLPLTGGTLSGPGTLTVAGLITAQNGITMTSATSLLWNNDNAHRIVDLPASNRMEFYEWLGEFRFYQVVSGNYMRFWGTGADYRIDNPAGAFFIGPAGNNVVMANAYYDGSSYQRWATANPSAMIYAASAAAGGNVFGVRWIAAGTGVINWPADVFSVTTAGNVTFAGTVTATGFRPSADGGTLQWPGGAYLNASGTTVNLATNLNVSGGITMPQNQSVKWQDANSQMMSYGRNSYFDEYNGSWSWRDTSAGSVNRMALSAGGSLTVYQNLQVNGYFNGGVTTAGTININTINGGGQLTFAEIKSNDQYQWADGSYMISSGWVYIRSAGSGLLVQNTGGSYVTMQVGPVVSINGSITVDQSNSAGSLLFRDTNVLIQRPQSLNYMLFRSYDSDWQFQDASGNARYRVLCNSQCDHYGNNGSTNHRFFHHDTSWMGCQAANFTPQSDARFKKDLQPMADAEALDRLRRPVPIVTWQPDWQPHRTVGFTAQDMEPVVPEVVQTDADGNMFLNYDFLTAVLWGALRAIDQRLQAVEER